MHGFHATELGYWKKWNDLVRYKNTLHRFTIEIFRKRICWKTWNVIRIRVLSVNSNRQYKIVWCYKAKTPSDHTERDSYSQWRFSRNWRSSTVATASRNRNRKLKSTSGEIGWWSLPVRMLCERRRYVSVYLHHNELSWSTWIEKNASKLLVFTYSRFIFSVLKTKMHFLFWNTRSYMYVS